MKSAIKEMKSFGYTNIVQVAHRDDCDPSCATLLSQSSENTGGLLLDAMYKKMFPAPLENLR